MQPEPLPHAVHRGGTPKKKVVTATSTQRETVRAHSGTNLRELTPQQLNRALRILADHPDAHSAGYSEARRTRERLEKELATRPAC